MRRLQDLRREAGLDVSDRIHVRYEGDDVIAAVAAAHGDYIAAETLALSLKRATGRRSRGGSEQRDEDRGPRRHPRAVEGVSADHHAPEEGAHSLHRNPGGSGHHRSHHDLCCSALYAPC